MVFGVADHRFYNCDIPWHRFEKSSVPYWVTPIMQFGHSSPRDFGEWFAGAYLDRRRYNSEDLTHGWMNFPLYLFQRAARVGPVCTPEQVDQQPTWIATISYQRSPVRTHLLYFRGDRASPSSLTHIPLRWSASLLPLEMQSAITKSE